MIDIGLTLSQETGTHSLRAAHIDSTRMLLLRIAIACLCLLNTLAFMYPRLRPKCPALRASSADGVSKEAKLCSFIREAEGWGSCRFVVQGEGAILESMGKLTEMRTSTNPNTGAKLITLSNEGIPGFECHIRVDQVTRITSSKVSKFDKNLRVTRFLGEDDKNLLSIILSEEEGSQAAWEASREKFGAEFII